MIACLDVNFSFKKLRKGLELSTFYNTFANVL